MSPSPWHEVRAPRPWVRGVASFVAIIFAGWYAWTPLSSHFSGAFSELATLALGSADFGRGGHAEFFRTQGQDAPRVDRDASWDASVELSIDGVRKTHIIAINPRRLAYLPLLFFAAFLAASPLPLRRKAQGMLIGVPLLLLVALGSVWITIAWLFARVPGLVYDFAPWQRSVLHLVYEGFVTPIANKFIVPLLLALAISSWRTAQQAPGAGVMNESRRNLPAPAQRVATARSRNSRQRRKR